MEFIRFSVKNDEIHIDDYPDALKVIRLNFNLKIKRLASLVLNLYDLRRAKQALSDINQVSNEFLRNALWDYAMIIFIKCFDNAISRNNLNYKKVYAGDELGKEVFRYFLNLRNKHIVHDENSFSECLIGAIIANEKKQYKIEKVICIPLEAQTPEQVNYSNLMLLIDKAINYIEIEYDKLAKSISDELEKEKIEALMAMEQLRYIVPDYLKQIDKPRNST